MSLVWNDSDTTPKLHICTCDTALQSHSQLLLQNGFLTAKNLTLVVTIFLLKQVTFGSINSLFLYSTHKLCFLSYDTLFPE